ncbi:MAG: hypothetical protein EA400_05635 [Chromatiaceae bacterium]|nr:MAG: hypothetical protein EA400_05635 [Chromatiaceae bacterium]
MPKPPPHRQWKVIAAALWLVCVALPALGQEPACLSTGGCLGFPDADAQSGKFINVTRGLSSLGDVGTGQRVFNISLEIPAARADFELAIFDGELGGRWDRWTGSSANLDNIIFKLYRDPQGVGTTDPGDLLYAWPAASMPDDAWCTLNPDYPLDPVNNPVCVSGSIPQDAGAFNLDRNAHIYHLVADWATTNRTNEQNNFKVVVEGQPFLLAGSTIGFQGFKYQHSNGLQLGAPTVYDGRFGFKFFVPDGTSSLVFYDGDADFADDTDDLNSDNCTPNTTGCGFPPFQTSPATIAQGANPGVPPDDLTSSDPAFDALIAALIRVEPSVFYRILPPAVSDWPEGRINDDVSGDKEWEFYGLGVTIADCVAPGNPGVPGCDDTVPSIPAGLYTWQFEGVDGFNTIYLHTDYDVFPELASIGDTVWFDANPDGFWADNPFVIPVGNEPGIPNVQVNLYRDVNRNEALDAGDDFEGFACTDAGGQYLFADLPLDKYIVEIAQQNFATTGSACTGGGPGALVGLTQTLDRSTEPGDHFNRTTPWPVDLPTNINYSRADFGFVESELASLGNTVWYDANRDGFWDDNPSSPSPTGDEPGIAGVQVNLYRDVNGDQLLDDDDEFVGLLCTDGNGQYLFTDLPLGDYLVQIAPGNFDATAGSQCTAGGPGVLVGLTQTVDRSSEPEDHYNRMTPWPVDLSTSSDYILADFGYVEADGGGQGCTPGYWRQPHHFGSWVNYQPSDLFASVFDDAFPGRTLLDVVRQGGGGLNALGRHTVAALLNAASPGVSYDLSVEAVIALFNQTYPGSRQEYEALKDLFEGFNEQGCPLGRSGNGDNGSGRPGNPPGNQGNRPGNPGNGRR